MGDRVGSGNKSTKEEVLVQAENGEMNGRQVPVGEFTGLVSLQLADLIQMVCLSRWDLIVRVSSARPAAR